jgi:phosphoribosylanthranilate isomerase
MRTRVKICGITNPEDARMALAAGADYLGLVLTASPRQVSLDQGRRVRDALPPGAPLVGVFAEERPEVVAPSQMDLGLSVIQVGGWLDAQPELACEVWHVLRAAVLPDPSALPMVPLRTYLLEAYDPSRAGGTGKTADWDWARLAVGAGLRLIVAGGLTPENVGDLVEEVRPHGVDVSSGVERSPGRKDPDLVRAFIERVRAADRARPKRS